MEHRFLQLRSGLVNHLDLGSRPIDTLAVHGLGGSATNWVELGRFLTSGIRAIDLPGFGFSPPLRRHHLSGFRDVVIEILEELGSRPFLMGNSMGGLVAMTTASLRPDLISGLILISPAVRPAGRMFPTRKGVSARLLAQALPVAGPALTRLVQARTTPAQQARLTFELITADPARIPPSVMETAEEMGAMRRHLPWVGQAFHQSILSTGLMLAHRDDFDRMTSSIEAPTLLLYGDEDPVVEPVWMEELGRRHPEWTTRVMAGVGHVPMLEAPVWTAELIEEWKSVA